MLSKLKKLFERDVTPEQVFSSQVLLNQAIAALFVEVAKADLAVDETEVQKIKTLLTSQLEMDEAQSKVLIEMVEEADKGLHPFTSLINQHYDYDEKIQLMKGLWAVAFADGELSKYEDAVIRRIADLLYVRHSDFIKSKHQQSN